MLTHNHFQRVLKSTYSIEDTVFDFPAETNDPAKYKVVSTSIGLFWVRIDQSIFEFDEEAIHLAKLMAKNLDAPVWLAVFIGRGILCVTPDFLLNEGFTRMVEDQKMLYLNSLLITQEINELYKRGDSNVPS